MSQETFSNRITTMQHEHQCWHEENQRWRSEADTWQREITAAMEQLTRLEKSVQASSSAVADHVLAINDNERVLAEHEACLWTYERGESRMDVQERLTCRHQEQAASHIKEREKHEELRRSMQRFLARVKALTEAT